MQFFIRFLLLAAGFALFTFGLLRWAEDGFSLSGLLPFTDTYRTQGLHFLMLGLAMIPPSLWEIFSLERIANTVRSNELHQPTAEGASGGSAPPPSERHHDR